MAAAFDATFIMPLLRPEVGFPPDSAGKPIEKAKERLAYLVEGLERSATRIVIPTPALSEILVRAGTRGSQQIVETLDKSRIFKIEPFDTLAAIEVATMTREALDEGDKRKGLEATWAKVKYDRQIVAIAKVHGATVIYSDDRDVAVLGAKAGLQVIGFSELPLPPEDPQVDMFKETENAESNDTSDDIGIEETTEDEFEGDEPQI
jgi:predicted nucleic acid-binding protein